MAGLVAVTLEGVLRAPIGGGVIPEGYNLYQALVTTYRVAIMLDDTELELTRMWLHKEGFRDYVQVIPLRPVDHDMLGFERGTTLPPRLSQLRRARGAGGIELMIDPDPAAVAGAMEMGITAMLFGHPKVARPEFRPDHVIEPRPWSELVKQVEFQRTVEPRGATL